MGCGSSKQAYDDPNAYAGKPMAGGAAPPPQGQVAQPQQGAKPAGRGRKAAKNLGFISMLAG
ncbi:hypothetical protein Slin15195_G070470 [Septoria linicola]|uniref:Uncharacterized protein n=1 Tax=Septoria linicola TaxID=215465 RepID=A0A9Q9AX68_9PEZI|nr:hypothetical protein Slin14017_G103220 [Septoria linicola]USW53728.1 hypothetical protein Slin15195_G070470 [Septoria linicola]